MTEKQINLITALSLILGALISFWTWHADLSIQREENKYQGYVELIHTITGKGDAAYSAQIVSVFLLEKRYSEYHDITCRAFSDLEALSKISGQGWIDNVVPHIEKLLEKIKCEQYHF
ncbi:MAG: hypothetical protein KTR28_09010 [Micavibrio sp.]|nr:hypothetical protein [Micavibrio sp.]